MESLRIYCVSWNVETTWPDQDLKSLLSLNEKGNLFPDIFIICLQEVRSQPQNVIMDALFEEPWATAFRDQLGCHDYVKLTGERLQGITISLFILRKHLHHVRDIYTTVARTGLAGFWGNKGAVSLRFSLYGCSFCIVNCHLAPHDSGYMERCSNYNYIVDSIVFPIKPTTHILFHDYVLWMGDLNFRLSGSITAKEIDENISSGNLSKLQDMDELNLAKMKQDALGPLSEGPLTFPPTYKYQVNSNKYDLSRRPAWTDRILHQVHVNAYEDNIKLGLEQLKYASAQEYGQSDHKPVVAVYTAKVFAHHTERCVKFRPIKDWIIGEVNMISLSLESDVSPSQWDYITMLKENFTSVHQYVSCTYVPFVDGSQDTSKKDIKVPFADDLVQSPGKYVLLYYSYNHRCYLGMSEPFTVARKC